MYVSVVSVSGDTGPMSLFTVMQAHGMESLTESPRCEHFTHIFCLAYRRLDCMMHVCTLSSQNYLLAGCTPQLFLAPLVAL